MGVAALGGHVECCGGLGERGAARAPGVSAHSLRRPVRSRGDCVARGSSRRRDCEVSPDSTSASKAIAPSTKHDDSIGEQDRLVHVVSDEQHGGAMTSAEPLEQRVHLDAREGVQRAEGLIEQHQLGLAHERSGERHALCLATRKREGPVPRVFGQAHFVERLKSASAQSPIDFRRREPSPSSTLVKTFSQGTRRAS